MALSPRKVKASAPVINTTLNQDVDEEVIEKHKQFRKIGTPQYKPLSRHRVSLIQDDPLLKLPKFGDVQEGGQIKQEVKLYSMRNQLSEIEAVAIVSVLESVVDMLNILSYTNDKPQVTPNISYQTLDERFSTVFRPETVDSDQKEYDPLSRYEIFKKIQLERGALELTLDSAIDDLIQVGSYKTLEEYVINKTFAKFEEDQLIQQLQRNEEAAAEVKAKITKHKYFMESMSGELEKKIANVKDTTYDISTCNDIEKRYIWRWEKARRYQHHYALSRQETKLKAKVKDLRKGVDYEIHANYQVLAFLSLDIEQLSYDVKMWNDKSFEDLEEIDLLTQKKKTYLEHMEKEVAEAAEVLKERHYKIVSTLVRRILPLRCRLFHEKREEAAIKIQKWWRAKQRAMRKRKLTEALTRAKSFKLKAKRKKPESNDKKERKLRTM